jgi:hypothetical protein
MKMDKMGDARGRPSWGSRFVGDPGAIFFDGKRDTGTKQEQGPACEENSVRSFYFGISSLAEPLAAAHSGQRARRCSGAAERTLDGEDRCESLGEGGKDLVLQDADLGKTEEQG